MKASTSKRLAALLRSDRGATAIEYGLILALIALGAFAAISGVGGTTSGMWNGMNNDLAEVL